MRDTIARENFICFKDSKERLVVLTWMNSDIIHKCKFYNRKKNKSQSFKKY